MKTYIFDIDGTLCTNTDGKYSEALPISHRINLVNKLYSEGHRVLLLTARGMGRSSNDAEIARQNWEEFTIQQLANWDVKYHQLFMGKPAGDYYIDDKGIKDEDFFQD